MQDTIIANREKLLSVLKVYAPYTYFHVLTDEDRYAGVSVDDPTRISYAEKAEDKFDYKRRRITTLGRYLNKLGLDVDHYKVAAIISQLVPLEDRFAIRDDIYDTYNREGMPSSCMIGEDCIYLYEEMPEVKILVLDDKARALLWNNKYIDRVYPDEPLVVEMYQRYAKANNMLMLDQNSYGQSWGEDVSIEISRSAVENHGMPYMDTIRYARNDDNTIVLSTNSFNYDCLCDNTGGEIYFCENCGRICDNPLDYEIDGMNCCYRCYHDSNTCDSCSCSTFDDLETVAGMDVCESCVGLAETCQHCNELTFDGLRSVGHEECCESCYEQAEMCENCDELTFDITEVRCLRCCDDCADATSKEVEENVDAQINSI